MEKDILKDFSTNIIKWYKFKENSQILYVGENESIVKYLSKNCKVKSIKLIETNKENKIFDYIIIDIPEMREDDILKLKENVAEEGKIIFLLDNKYGISNFITYNYENQISPLEEESKYPNIDKICELLRNNNFFVNKYMVYPNKNKVDLIINENYKEISDKIEKYFYNYGKERVILGDEIKILKNILKYDRELFNRLANSYFIEASLKQLENNIKYVSFNNYRNEQYRLITKIEKDIVSKQEENEAAKAHIQQIVENLKYLKMYNFKILDKYEDNILYSDLIKNNKTLDAELAEKADDIEYVIGIISKIKDELLKHSVSYEQINNNSLYKQEDEELLKELNFLEYAFYDMIPKNCFYIDGEFYFFDQEWMEKYLPVEFIIYRSIINSYDLVRKINIEEVFEKLNISKYRKLFEQIDFELRQKLINQERLDICQKQYPQMYDIIYINKVYESQIQNYQENDQKQNQYINCLEEKINRLNKTEG